jgi:hypothetical protein
MIAPNQRLVGDPPGAKWAVRLLDHGEQSLVAPTRTWEIRTIRMGTRVGSELGDHPNGLIVG